MRRATFLRYRGNEEEREKKKNKGTRRESRFLRTPRSILVTVQLGMLAQHTVQLLMLRLS